jgi:hypothetical protein
MGDVYAIPQAGSEESLAGEVANSPGGSSGSPGDQYCGLSQWLPGLRRRGLLGRQMYR